MTDIDIAREGLNDACEACDEEARRRLAEPGLHRGQHVITAAGTRAVIVWAGEVPSDLDLQCITVEIMATGERRATYAGCVRRPSAMAHDGHPPTWPGYIDHRAGK